MKTSWKIAACALCFLSLGSIAWSLKAMSTGEAMTSAARSYLETLSEEQRQTAVMPYDSMKRTQWHFVPQAPREGMMVKDLNKKQRKAAFHLLQQSLSKAGYKKATGIMELETLLHELQQGRSGPIRDPERYWFAIFGEPGKERWSLSVEGHHLSMNFTIEGGEVLDATPFFFGSNPAVVKSDAVDSIPRGTEVLKQEEALAFELLGSLTSDQRAEAIFDEKAPREIRAPGEIQPPTEAAIGLTANKMEPEQRKLLQKLVRTYIQNAPQDVAKQRMQAIQKSGWKEVHFAWAGADTPGIGHYYRVQGPTFLIEFVNTQPDPEGNPANHAHAVWRDMQGDFALPIAATN
ncbi:Hypothetical protein PBC10988_10880 [Planctomycetales bacterium 10988]|nr:Hypothetical protein PBC10988_10880 [Planctomycetales bacterium 10988]